MPNGLARAKSPYLRQHEFNPTQWLPWGEEALERAQRGRKPILLSIGYAACHWCHVMARESFEDPDTAALMNRHFINIKVDREERPDVDAVYLRAASVGTRDFQETLVSTGFEPSPSTPAEFAAYLRTEISKWTRVIRMAGITRS